MEILDICSISHLQNYCNVSTENISDNSKSNDARHIVIRRDKKKRRGQVKYPTSEVSEMLLCVWLYEYWKSYNKILIFVHAKGK